MAENKAVIDLIDEIEDTSKEIVLTSTQRISLLEKRVSLLKGLVIFSYIINIIIAIIIIYYLYMKKL